MTTDLFDNGSAVFSLSEMIDIGATRSRDFVKRLAAGQLSLGQWTAVMIHLSPLTGDVARPSKIT